MARTTITHLMPVISRGGLSGACASCCFSASRSLMDVFSDTSSDSFLGAERKLLFGEGVDSLESIDFSVGVAGAIVKLEVCDGTPEENV